MTSRRSFGLNRKSVAGSRQFVRDAVADLPKDIRDAAILMTSELATNAIVHAATGFEVVVDRSEDSLRVAVTDVGGGEPELQTPPSSEVHGRGLQIVEELSDDWGMIDNDDHSGKTVWYAVRLDHKGPSEVGRASARDDAGRRPTGGTGRRRAKGGGERPAESTRTEERSLWQRGGQARGYRCSRADGRPPTAPTTTTTVARLAPTGY